MLPLILTVLGLFTSVKSQGCNGPLGMESRLIKDDQITASSHERYHQPNLARLNEKRSPGAWCSKNHLEDKKPWIKITFDERKKVTKIAVQGRDSQYSGWYVVKFRVGYEKDKRIYFLPSVFDGPKSKSDIAYAEVDLETALILIEPVSWHPYDESSNTTRVCLRLEIYGCKAPPDFCLSKDCEYKCKNTASKAVCECPPGFRVRKDGTCEEIDECAERLAKCNTQTTACVNTVGSYECLCNDPGLEKVSIYACSDIDECRHGNGRCQHHCTNTYKSYKCSCYQGYYLGNDTHSCIDENECTNGVHRCNLTSTTCENVPGSYACRCLSGLQHYRLDMMKCQDINECEVNKGGCEETCTNTYRSYKCSCPNGTVLHTDQHKCYDINECAQKIDGCEQVCQNHYGGYLCFCRQGFRLNSDKKTCSDVNECQESVNGKSPCGHICHNTIGSFTCSCPPGFDLGVDKSTCVDIDECASRLDNCDDGTSTCVNIHGSYECRCKSGYYKDENGQCTAKKCPALKAATNGYLSPSDCIKSDSKIFKDVCTFQCNAGYELNEASVKTAFCNSDGHWDLRGGYQAICQRIRCGKLTEVSGGSLVPSVCTITGVSYGERCEVYCNNGYYVEGQSSVTCNINGTYDGTFTGTKCLKRERIQCPSDVKVILPIGTNETTLPLAKLDVKLDVSKLVTSPPGVLTGQYKFSSKISSQVIKLMFKDYPQESCTFYVTVEDREPPTFTNCPSDNIYVALSDSNMKVEWPEPSFTDNVGVVKVIQNMKTDQILPQQVYYVFYAARDEYGNEAICRFFVHVKVRYCSKTNVAGGEGGTMVWFGGGNTLSLFLQCPPATTFSKNITQASIFRCTNGVWEDIPDCIAYSNKNGTCPTGQTEVFSTSLGSVKCGNCPKGTKWTTSGCEKCPLGSYQDAEGQTACKECPIGTTSNELGVKSVLQCKVQCPPGAYSLDGLYGSAGCDRCPEGSFQDLYGQKSCKLCPHGGSSDKGATSENECYLPARVSAIIPRDGFISAKTGDTMVIKCYGTGNPAPYMQIKNVTQLPPDSFRGEASLKPLVTGNRYISGIELIIKNVQAPYDSQVYKCTADNRQGNRGNLDEREIVINVQ